MKTFVRLASIAAWSICLVCLAGGIVVLWLSIGVAKSAVQETDAEALAAVIIIGGYVFARAITKILRELLPEEPRPA